MTLAVLVIAALLAAALAGHALLPLTIGLFVGVLFVAVEQWTRHGSR